MTHPGAGTRLLHVTLGPVQGFVAEARRTRDLWAGSFLLSWLAGRAMVAVERGGGRILLPDVRQDALMEAIRTPPGGFGPAVGSLPNRFKARVPTGFDPRACRGAVDIAWRKLAGDVWTKFVGPVAEAGRDTKVIWDRQVAGFWDVAWVVGDDPGDRSDLDWLDRRKNWRSWRPPVEGGDHCTLMGDWQELSGFVRARDRGVRQDAFWKAMREHIADVTGSGLDLDERERLCAMALIKRLFLEVAGEAIGWTPSWDRQKRVRWPSTSRLAAASWLGLDWRAAQTEVRAFVDAVRPSGRGHVEPPLAADNALSRVSGQFLHRSSIENAPTKELGDADRPEMLAAHDALTRAAGRAPSAFYAVVLMDGDSVGRLLNDHSEEKVASALAQFASGVDGRVREAGGYTIYAGGDDLLALLPIETALAAAMELRRAYVDAFASADMAKATTSAALVFAHFRMPLRQVLREAHARLDRVAKDGNGRDSLAVCALSQGGVLRQWVSAWDPQPAGTRPPALLNTLAAELDDAVAGRFFYKVRQTWGDVLSLADGGSEGPALFTPEQARRLLLAELVGGGSDGAEKAEGADVLIRDILVLARCWPGADEGGEPRSLGAPAFDFDGPLLARFLGRERVPDKGTT